ncbi:MAG: carbon-nitrogen hydrolase [Woeseia sp.]|nr:carbon-nitrogen hydrolase [Woeseia sp.]
MNGGPQTAGTLKLGLVQMAMGEDPEENTERAVALTIDAAQRGAEVICLPELFRSRYFCQTEDSAFFQLADTVPNALTERFATVAAEHDVAIIASLFEKRTTGLYHNTVAVIDRGKGYIGKYRKMHIPDDPRYYEKFYFAPGDLGFKTFPTERANLGVLICWDQWYPEAARLTALQGAEVLFYPTAIGWHPEEKAEVGAEQHEAWETIQRSHAIANGCFVVAVNRFGFEPDPSGDGGIEFWGQSFVVAPDGRIIVRAPVDQEAALVVDVDLAEMSVTRHGWPFLRDRRVDAYAPIANRFLDND